MTGRTTCAKYSGVQGWLTMAARAISGRSTKNITGMASAANLVLMLARQGKSCQVMVKDGGSPG